jgi:hypothetical protein
MYRKSSTSLLFVAVLLGSVSLLGACAMAPATTSSAGQGRSLQSGALPPAGDAGQ